MKSAKDIAADWVAYTRLSPQSAPDDLFDRGWLIYEMAEHDPALAWEAIKAVVTSFKLSDLVSESATEAKKIVSNTAAGPLEDLLASHGDKFIDAVELEARDDPRMRWALSGVWQNAMPDSIWARVQHAAGQVRR